MMSAKIYKLLGRYFSGKCTDIEKKQIEHWISKNQPEFEELRKIWEFSRELREHWNTGVALQKFKMTIDDLESSKASRNGLRILNLPSRKKTFVSSYAVLLLKAAAVVLALIGSLYILRSAKEMALQKDRMPTSPQFLLKEVSTRNGQKVDLKFDDGTRIILNSSSKISYVENADRTREVYLSGEAYFDVVHNSSSPFVVHTSKAVIKDLGTRFDVRSWPDDGKTDVVVAEGTVSVQSEGGQSAVRVSAGEGISLDQNGTIVKLKHVDLNQAIAWTEGKIILRNTAMKDVVRQIWHEYGIKIFTADSSILSRTITATLTKKESANEVLNIIALSLNITYRDSNDSVILLPSKPHLRWDKTNKEDHYEKHL
ncbi:MAG: FecR family protein [Candidatus Kryptoniota bacterium]